MSYGQRRARVCLAAILGVLTALAVGGCVAGTSGGAARTAPVAGPPGPPVSMFAQEPAVRVRIRRAATSVTLGAPVAPTAGDGRYHGNQVTLRAAGGQALEVRAPTQLSRSQGVWRITDEAGRTTEFRGDVLTVVVPPSLAARVDDGAYPGTVSLRAASGPNGIDVVNTVGMEQYLPGVLARELFPNWEPTAFEAQAVAARSYALWEIQRARTAGKPYDLESTTASQAYVGVTHNAKPHEAVRRTRGEVLVYDGRVVPAFYASAHGGLGADGPTTFPGRAPDIAPLRARPQGDWDHISNRNRWQATCSANDLAARLSAWGRANHHPIARLRGPVLNITVAEVNAVGRHQAYFVDDSAGLRYPILADQLRHAANFTLSPEEPSTNTIGSAGDLAKLSADNTLYSGHFTPVVRGGTVYFNDGHGYGHGVGMSQWGAQGMALAGHDYRAILTNYYPGATVRRAY